MNTEKLNFIFPSKAKLTAFIFMASLLKLSSNIKFYEILKDLVRNKLLFK